MAPIKYHVTALGNAIVDVLARTDDSFLSQHNLAKGVMSLVDFGAAARTYEVMGPGIEVSGGSAANTVAGVAGLGGRAAFVGKVADDQLGQVFSHDIRAAGVAFDPTPLRGGPSTGRCLILVTPDAERTMQTFLGASAELGPEDVDPELIGASEVVYLEGYLWDQPRAKEAFIRASEIAAASSRKVALTLSDPFCVDRHRDEFLHLIEHHVDVLFANEDEIKSLYQVRGFEAAQALVKGHCEIAVLTRSEKGSVVVNRGTTHVIAAERVEEVVDTTGAGDAYAAGFLYAYTHGRDLRACARLGGMMAAEVISHYGARAEADLRKMAALVS